MVGKVTRTVQDRFDEKWRRDPDSGCWVWVRGTRNGYGYFRGWAVNDYAHRMSWRLHRDDLIGAGLFVCHTCDNKLCVNPAHLFLGTDRDNKLDMYRKGRHAVGSRMGNSKLTESDIPVIFKRWGEGDLQRDIATSFNVSQQHISAILNRRWWRTNVHPVSVPKL